MKGTLRVIAAFVAGFTTAAVIANLGLSATRAFWPEYAAAEPSKAYTLAMLFSRLGVAALCVAGAGCAATLVAGDGGRAAWWLGGMFVVVSLPSHLYYVRDDYPAWYHFLYLGYLIPIAGFSGRALRAAIPRKRPRT